MRILIFAACAGMIAGCAPIMRLPTNELKGVPTEQNCSAGRFVTVDNTEPDDNAASAGGDRCMSFYVNDEFELCRGDNERGQLLLSATDHVEAHGGFVFSPACEYVACTFFGSPGMLGAGDATHPHIRVWKVSSGRLAAWFDLRTPRVGTQPIEVLAFTSGDRTLIAWANDSLLAYDILDRRELCRQYVGNGLAKAKNARTGTVFIVGDSTFRFIREGGK